jgi:hypothetical protein
LLQRCLPTRLPPETTHGPGGSDSSASRVSLPPPHPTHPARAPPLLFRTCPARRQQPGESQHGGDGLWGTDGEVPSFLYAMPLGGGRVFLEETCLVARPAMPFATLKRRLERRCRALGIKVRRCKPFPKLCPGAVRSGHGCWAAPAPSADSIRAAGWSLQQPFE